MILKLFFLLWSGLGLSGYGFAKDAPNGLELYRSLSKVAVVKSSSNLSARGPIMTVKYGDHTRSFAKVSIKILDVLLNDLNNDVALHSSPILKKIKSGEEIEVLCPVILNGKDQIIPIFESGKMAFLRTFL